MKITLSKSQWEFIGKKAQWIKEEKSLEDFIEENRDTINAAIVKKCPNCKITNDDERKKWILNDEELYNLAKSEGVQI